MELNKLEENLRQSLLELSPPLKVKKETKEYLEVMGTKETMQGKQKVDGIFFASVVHKPKDVRLYYFPIYTDPEEFPLSENLKKLLKGKSCFHLKKVDDDLFREIREMIRKGVEVYQRKELL